MYQSKITSVIGVFLPNNVKNVNFLLHNYINTIKKPNKQTERRYHCHSIRTLSITSKRYPSTFFERYVTIPPTILVTNDRYTFLILVAKQTHTYSSIKKQTHSSQTSGSFCHSQVCCRSHIEYNSDFRKRERVIIT